MMTQKIKFENIISAVEKELYVGSSTIIVNAKTTTHYLSPLMFRQCIRGKMNYVTNDGLFEFEYDVLLYIDDMMNNNNK